MSTRTTSKVWAGPVTAYALEVYYNGYTGTLTEWLQHLANTTDNAEACQRYAEAAEESAAVADQIPRMVTEALETLSSASNEHLNEIALVGRGWKESVESAGSAQTAAVRQTGTDQVAAVNAAGSIQVQAVADEGTDQITAVGQAGTNQVGAVNAAGSIQVQAVADEGTDQITAVGQAGTDQVDAVEDKGVEVLASIPSDYTTLSDMVTLLGVDSIPDTVQSVTYGSDGKPSAIVHARSGVPVRTDTFVWGADTVTETRTLAGGHYITMTTNLTTLVTTVSDIQEGT